MTLCFEPTQQNIQTAETRKTATMKSIQLKKCQRSKNEIETKTLQETLQHF